jgi:hypothetical protein
LDGKQAVSSNSDVSVDGLPVAAGVTGKTDADGGLSWVERMIRDQVAVTLFGKEPGQWKPWSYLLIATTVGYAGYMLSQAMRLSPPSSQELWFPSSHMLNGDFYNTLRRASAPPCDRQLQHYPSRWHLLRDILR